MKQKFWKSVNHTILAGVTGVMLTACVSTRPETASITAQPKTAPVRTITSFSPSLACMDNLFLANGVEDFVITSAGIPDATGRIGRGTKEMLISAISRMSLKSRAFAFVDFDQSQIGVAQLQELVGLSEDFRVPNFYIRGAVTQFDSQVQDNSGSAGIRIGPVPLFAGKSEAVALIAIDLNVANLVTRQILHGVSASNTIAITQQSTSADGNGFAGQLGKVGVSFNISLSEAEGTHQALRTLVDLTAIEILGKLTQVPYWQCLQIDQTNPAVIVEARGWYDAMSPAERITYAQKFLNTRKFYAGPTNGIADSATITAIAQYQSENDLIANGRMNFDLYYRMISAESSSEKQFAALDKSEPSAPVVEKPVEKEAMAPPVKAPEKPKLVVTTPKGISPNYKLGETLRILVTTDRDSYLYCYYGDPNGNIARIFPNRFSPNALIRGGSQASVPGPDDLFDIVMDTVSDREQVVCYASETEVGLVIPNRLKVEDLEPVPVSSIDELTQAYQTAGASAVAMGQIRIKVSE